MATRALDTGNTWRGEDNSQIIREFARVYNGGLAQARRDRGEFNSLPPAQETYWMGRQVCKCPLDLWVYQEIIWETKPDLIIECGTGSGGSAWFFATLFDLMGIDGHVVTVDVDTYPALHLPHDKITYMRGSSVDPEIALAIHTAVPNGARVMVSLDSGHSYEHVRAEIEAYATLVSPGCYLVVEDTGCENPSAAPQEEWCNRAAFEFVRDNPGFEMDISREKFLYTSNGGGWIRRRK